MWFHESRLVLQVCIHEVFVHLPYVDLDDKSSEVPCITIFVNLRLSCLKLIYGPQQHDLMFGSSYLNHLDMSSELGSWYEHPLQSICILQHSPIKSYNILVFASPTGYMLTSSGFPLLNWGIFFYNSSKMVSNFPDILNFNRLFLKLNRFICN
jgi:hypothetical protein